MLYHLFDWLATEISGFNAFRYITLRAILAALTALVISLAAGGPVIRYLTALRLGQQVRQDGPQTHLGKAGTPTTLGFATLISLFDNISELSEWVTPDIFAKNQLLYDIWKKS